MKDNFRMNFWEVRVTLNLSLMIFPEQHVLSVFLISEGRTSRYVETMKPESTV